MSDGVVLDASALLALPKDEPGAGEVAGVMAASRISAVNLAEVISHFIYTGMPASEVDAMLNPLPMTVIDADADLAATTPWGCRWWWRDRLTIPPLGSDQVVRGR